MNLRPVPSLVLVSLSLLMGGCSDREDEDPADRSPDPSSTWRVASQNGWEVNLPPGWHRVPVRFGEPGRSPGLRLAFASYDPGGAAIRDVCQPGKVTDSMGTDDVLVELMPDTAGNAWQREHRSRTPKVVFRGRARECGETIVTRWSQGKLGIPVIARIWAGSERLSGSQRDQVEATLASLSTGSLGRIDPGISPTKTVPPVRVRSSEGLQEMVMMVPPYFILYSSCGRDSRELLVGRAPGGKSTSARIEADGTVARTGDLLRGPVRVEMGDAGQATVNFRQSSSDRGNVEGTVVVEYPPGTCQVRDTELEIRTG